MNLRLFIKNTLFSKERWFFLVVFTGLFLIFPYTPLSYTAFDKGFTSQQSDSTIKVSVIFAGDAMVHSTQYNSAYISTQDAYDFAPVFQYLVPFLAASDVNVINLETTLGGKPYAGYPNFSSPDTFAYALKEAGFNYIATANNHSLDKGKNGLLRTLEVLDAYQFTSFGTYRDSTDRTERYPLMIEVSGIKIALLNYTYGTNGIPIPHPTIVNMIDTAQISRDITTAKEKEADIVMVYFHWGNEYNRQPNNQQRNLAAYTFNAGADIIIGAHPHVVQAVEFFEYETGDTTDNKWVAWSLGNFISNQRKEHTDGGIMLKFTIEKNIYTHKTFISNMTYIPYWVYRPLNPTRYFILPLILMERNDSLFTDMSEADKRAMSFFAQETRALLKGDTVFLREALYEELYKNAQ